jgi:hypothetical protein
MENDRGSESTKVHFKHIWICHNETPPVQPIYANKMLKTQLLLMSILL